MITGDISHFIPEKDFRIAFFTDGHDGNIAASDPAKDKAVNYVKNRKDMYWGASGDMCDCIHVLDPRYDPAITKGKAALIDLQVKHVAKVFRPIAKRCLWWGLGNHEMTGAIKYTTDPAARIQEKMGINVPCAFDMKLKITDKCNGLITHGAFIPRSRAGDPDQIALNDGVSMKRKLRDIPGSGDCHFMQCGHGHRLILRNPIDRLYVSGIGELASNYVSRFYADTGEVHPDSRFYFMSGGFMRTVHVTEWDSKAKPGEGNIGNATTYSERRGYGSSDIGFYVGHFVNNTLDRIEEVRL